MALRTGNTRLEKSFATAAGAIHGLIWGPLLSVPVSATTGMYLARGAQLETAGERLGHLFGYFALNTAGTMLPGTVFAMGSLAALQNLRGESEEKFMNSFAKTTAVTYFIAQASGLYLATNYPFEKDSNDESTVIQGYEGAVVDDTIQAPNPNGSVTNYTYDFLR